MHDRSARAIALFQAYQILRAGADSRASVPAPSALKEMKDMARRNHSQQGGTR